MNDILKLIEAKETASRYIRSCTTLNHIDTMKKYLVQYRNQLDDLLSYQKLEFELIDKSREINGKI